PATYTRMPSTRPITNAASTARDRRATCARRSWMRRELSWLSRIRCGGRGSADAGTDVQRRERRRQDRQRRTKDRYRERLYQQADSGRECAAADGPGGELQSER